VLSASEVGMLARSDKQQLVWALEHQRIIYTFNVRDFYRINSDWLQGGKSHAGIIFGKQEHSIGDQMRGLLRLASIKSAEEMINTVEFLGRWL